MAYEVYKFLQNPCNPRMNEMLSFYHERIISEIHRIQNSIFCVPNLLKGMRKLVGTNEFPCTRTMRSRMKTWGVDYIQWVSSLQPMLP